jgi:hypothetical protein
MLRLTFVALVASTLIGCTPLRQGNDLGYDFGVYVDRAELPDNQCLIDIGLNNNLGGDYANFEYALNFYDSQGRWAAGPLVQGDYIPAGGLVKRDFTVPISCNRLAKAEVARELCLDIVGWPGHRDCHDIGRIVINETVAMAEPEPLGPPPDVIPPPSGKPRFYTIFFDWDKSNINPIAQRVVGTIVTDWAAEPDTLSLIGHADRSGPDKYNQGLSSKRVTSVTGALSAGGIDAARVMGSAKGESDPLVPTADGVREPRNRRVVVIVQ